MKQTDRQIRIAVAGVGNCASSLVQGIWHYRSQPNAIGLMHTHVGPYAVGDIEVVAAFDIDSRKVGRPVHHAIFAPPNDTQTFFQPSPTTQSPIVKMGPVLDGVAPHMLNRPIDRRFDVASNDPVDLARELRSSGAQILVNYMPVGSDLATRAYAQACLDAGVALVNCVPCFIVSDPEWAKKFERAGLPCVGDDIKAQVGATITHRTLAKLLVDRGVKIDRMYQLNVGGNTDFLNMLAHDRLTSKRQSKTQAVQSQLDAPLPAGQLHVGPSDYVPFLHDQKVCYLRIEGRGFGGVAMNLELRLSVEDSPNSASVVVDAIRAAKLALDRKIVGPIHPACAWCMKSPPVQMSDVDALDAFNDFAQRSL